MSPSGHNIIDVIVAKTGMKQKDIAEKLGVSRAMVSKWRSGGDIPSDRRKILYEMAELFDENIEWSLLAKTEENAENWIKFFKVYHDEYLEVDSCNKLSDEPEIWVPPMLILFKQVGIKIPEIALDHDIESDDGIIFDELVKEYLESYSALTNWSEKNIHGIDEGGDCDILEETMELEGYIADFAIVYVDKKILSKLGADLPTVEKKVTEARRNLSKIIITIVEIMVSKNIPIMMDYFELVNKHPYDMDDEECKLFAKKTIGYGTIESMLPLFERSVLEQNRLTTQLLTELHLKIDLLLKPEDIEKLSGSLELTYPKWNRHLFKNKDKSE